MTRGWQTSRSRSSPCRCASSSLDEWWSRVSALAGPLANILAAMPPEAQHALRGRAQDAAAAYATADGFEFPGLALVAGATRT